MVLGRPEPALPTSVERRVLERLYDGWSPGRSNRGTPHEVPLWCREDEHDDFMRDDEWAVIDELRQARDEDW